MISVSLAVTPAGVFPGSRWGDRMIAFSCPACNRELRIKDELAGQKGKCPYSKRAIVVPQEQGAPVKPPAGGDAAPALDLDLQTLMPGQPPGDQHAQKTLLPGAEQ